MQKYLTKGPNQTKKIGKMLAENILELKKSKRAKVILLAGDLGGGKTTFLQGFAQGLGIEDRILSPTFVILKRFKIKNGNFYHIDCYRANSKELLDLGIEKIFSNPLNIIAIEWPERIGEIIPDNVFKIQFFFIDENTREIVFDF
jgi:tRNA threonylcarbamoyladenosine biosynthesis protein TsaE